MFGHGGGQTAGGRFPHLKKMGGNVHGRRKRGGGKPYKQRKCISNEKNVVKGK